MQTLAFTNTTYTKQSALALAQWHQDQDRFVLGTYGEALQEGWRGCSAGCIAGYPLLFGIDARIAHLSDKLFENIADYKQWTVKLFASVAEGSDTTLAFNRFMHWLIMDKQNGLIRFNASKVVSNVGELYAKVIAGETVTQDQWLAAARAAAANAAAYAAYATDAVYAANAAAYTAAANAANAAVYAAAANAANAAVYAANAAVYAANAATCYAVYKQQHYEAMADKLCFYLSGKVD